MTPLLPPSLLLLLFTLTSCFFLGFLQQRQPAKGGHLGLSSIVKTVLSILKSNFYRHWFGFLLHKWSNVQCPHSTYPLIQNSPISSPFLATQTETRHPINKQQASTMKGYLAGQRYKATTRTCDLELKSRTAALVSSPNVRITLIDSLCCSICGVCCGSGLP